MYYIIEGMIYLGSALMVFNIWRYYRYIQKTMKQSDWSQKRMILIVPLLLLIGFLIGYLIVGVLGHPDIVVSGILFGGSIFVAIIVNMLEEVTAHLQETGYLEARLMAAEESSRAKTAFLSNMSHEIRTPMNAIIGINALALRDGGISDETRGNLLKIDASARHLLGLINDILDMSRIESGQMIIREEPFSMDSLIEQVCSIIQSQCDDKGIEFVHELRGKDASSRGGVCCVGDEIKMRQVLINILGNAVKFTEAPGTITFICETTDRGAGDVCRAGFTIKDTGIGMDEEFLPNLFDTFSQEDATSTNRYGGSGLGMAITKKLVDMMGGTIEVQSKKGEGTTFKIDMDFRLISEEEAKAMASSGAVGSESETVMTAEDLKGCRILFAEDVEINAEILADLLEMEGMSSDWAENGQVAVNKFGFSKYGEYDAILMDMRMPVMDGLEAARHIRAMDRPDAKTIPIIALTANAFYSDVRQCLDAGMDTHLSKPVDVEQLTDALCSLISKNRNKS